MAILAQDTFIRGNIPQGGWGLSSDGNTWAVLHGVGPLYLANNEGRIAYSAGGHTTVVIGAGTVANLDATATMHAAASSDQSGIAARVSADGSSGYFCCISYSNILIMKQVSNSWTVIAQVTSGHTSTNPHNVRFRLNGSTLQGKVWDPGTTEPANWTISATDTDIAGAGQYGVMGLVGTGSDAAFFSGFSASTIGTTRAGRGRAKLIAASPSSRAGRGRAKVSLAVAKGVSRAGRGRANVDIAPLPALTGLWVSVGNYATPILLESVKVSERLNQRNTCSFAVRDDVIYALSQEQAVGVYADGVLLFAGFVETLETNRLMPNTTRIHAVVCKDLRQLADMHLYKGNDYTGMMGGDIAADLHKNYLAAEGVTANYVSDTDSDAASWAQGTLTNTSGAQGSLALTPGGVLFSKSERSTSDFAAGTLTNVVAASNQLQLTSYGAIKMTGEAYASVNANLFTYVKVWNGSQAIAAGDYLEYDIWVSSTSPEISGGVDVICSDGTTMRDAQPCLDQYQMSSHPSAVLQGFANDQWFYRKIGAPASLTGKTINTCVVALEGNKDGTYTFYVRNIFWRSSGGTLKATFYNGGALGTNQQLSNVGYRNTAVTATTVYEAQGVRVSPAYSIGGVGIASSSFIAWTSLEPPQTGGSGGYPVALLVETSLDGGASWQTCTNHAVMPGLIPGQVVTGRTAIIRETLSISGPNPELGPILYDCELTVQPSFATAKTDVWNGDTAGNMATGTLSAVTNAAAGLTLTGFYKNWDDADVTTGQTLFGAGVPGGPAASCWEGTLALRTDNGSDVHQQFNFAGQHTNFTVEMDVMWPAANTEVGMIYRTTYWGNGNDTYCYCVKMGTASLVLHHGTNNSTGGPTAVGSAAFAPTAGNWYRMKVVVNGTSHKIYIDDVLYINATDSFYTGAGYFGARFYDNTGARLSAFFNNFGQQDISTGSRVAPSVSISAVGTVLDSFIDWDADVPGNCSLDIQASINGGANYFSCTKEASIPTCLPGTNMAGKSLLVKAVLTANNANVTPTLRGVGWNVVSAYSAAGTRISQALDLSPVGRAGSTSVSWNADVPSGTTLGVDASPDGVTWTPVNSGDQIPGVTSASAPMQDEFDANRSGNYTSAFYAGGGAAVVTWDTANQQLQIAGGTNALYPWSILSARDVSVEAILNQANQGGLVARYVDTNNHYRVEVYDDTTTLGGGSSQLIRLYRRLAGVDTQLGIGTTVSFVRGTYHTLKWQLAATAITVWWDGTQVLALTDSPGYQGIGRVGFYSSSAAGSAYYQSIQVTQLGDDLTGKRVYTRERLATTDPTASPIVLARTVSARDSTLATGALIPQTKYAYKTKVSGCLDDVAQQSNGWWKIGNKAGELKKLIFLGRNALNAPWPLASINGDILAAPPPKLVHASPKYRNRQYITGAIDHVAVPESKVGDGSSQSWALSYPVDSITSVDVNGDPRTAGVQGTDTGMDFYYTPGQTTFAQDPTAIPVAEGDVVNILYQGQVPYIAMAENVAQQQLIALTSNTSGIIEETEDLPGSTRAAADALAVARITEFAIFGARDWDFSTMRKGLSSGQILSVFVPEVGINDGNFLITGVDTTLTQKSDGTLLSFYDVQTTEGPNIGSWTQLFASLT